MPFASKNKSTYETVQSRVHTDTTVLNMECGQQQPEEVEALVDTLTIDGASLNDAQLTAFTNCDLQQLAELSQELNLNNEMETSEQVEEVEVMDVCDSVVEEIVDGTEILEQEVVVETEREQTPDDMILPDVEKSTTNNKPVVPPLRPLSIAPKPSKVPITLKPVAGQQLLLLQGGTGGQAIKLINPQGQELNLSNISLGRPVSLKSNVKTITTTTATTTIQPKQVVMKRVIAPANKTAIPRTTNKQQSHIMVVQKSSEQSQQQGVKLMQNSSGNVVTSLPNPTKTISFQQAQEMGLITTMTKFVTQATTGKQQHTLMLNKPQSKAIKIVPQKSPTKILPAPQANATNKISQRIVIKPTSSTSQLIQVPQAIGSTQLHQINIPGKGVQYIKFVTTATSAETSTTQVLNTVSTAKTVLHNPLQMVQTTPTLKPANIVLSEIKPIPGQQPIAPKPAPKPPTRPAAVQVNTSPPSQVVVLPSSFIPQQTNVNSKVAIPVIRPATTPKTHHAESITTTNNTTTITITAPTNETPIESNGIRPRKPCNCTKSQCLKLYCDCFANGEFCYMCNCMNCFNNIQNEEHRQRAIKNCLERNPHAFRPKIGKAKDNSGEVAIRKHTKGCNCKRSGCLKNYCECYEAKIACSNNCKCIGCRNIEDSMEKKSLRQQAMNDSYISSSSVPTAKLGLVRDGSQMRSKKSSNNKQAFNLITNEVIEATSQCLLALTDNVDYDAQSEEETKKQIIEEFGRCLMEIISCSVDYNNGNNNNNTNNN